MSSVRYNQMQNCLRGAQRTGGAGWQPCGVPDNLFPQSLQPPAADPGLNLDRDPVLALPGNLQGLGVTHRELPGRWGRE